MRTAFKVIVLAFLAGWVFGFSVTEVFAGPNIVKIEGAEFSVSSLMADNLQNFRGRHVIVSLQSGETIGGKVGGRQ